VSAEKIRYNVRIVAEICGFHMAKERIHLVARFE
jgi:hypothetical protein